MILDIYGLSLYSIRINSYNFLSSAVTSSTAFNCPICGPYVDTIDAGIPNVAGKAHDDRFEFDLTLGNWSVERKSPRFGGHEVS